MTILSAHAKVNLDLRVRARRSDGFHEVRSLIQSIDLADSVSVDLAEDDAVSVGGDTDLGADEDNLAWRAVEAVRRASSSLARLAVHLDKRIPVAAGLGGGSADAAAALVATAGLLGVGERQVRALAPGLGSDVPVCLTGGSVLVEGRGEVLTPVQLPSDYHLAVVTPPFSLSTKEVFAAWDRLDGPHGPSLDGSALPPGLREYGPLVNDLVPAALVVRPDLGDWVAECSRVWGQEAMMTGSGPTVFGFFVTADEADDAVLAIDGRFGAAASPVDRGWDGSPGGTLPAPPWGVV
ncbi:MAG TPA: 4-(cytidine 5'-diphospho)-2-C-methyl-D-erythritol kinase [Acidimicrobiia bacterium]|nr:4-(cytidine 5'-diphospho)-2-C-methyl-D-erythritol kinase [Acidimicrobiia bacterium]